MTKKDTGEYSSSKAPDTRDHAEEKAGNYSDMRLIPGGAHGSDKPQGMDALDRESIPSGASDTGQTRYGDSPAENNTKPDAPR